MKELQAAITVLGLEKSQLAKDNSKLKEHLQSDKARELENA